MLSKLVLTMLVALGVTPRILSQPQSDCALRLDQKILQTTTSGPAESLRCVATSEHGGTYVLSWTTRGVPETTSHLRLVRIQAGSSQVLYAMDLRGGFGSLLEFSHRFAGHEAFLTVTTQYGAAAAEIRVMSVGMNSLRLVFQALGDYIDFFDGNNGKSVIAVHNIINSIDVPDLFQFRGGRFTRCNSLYPEYYRKLLANKGLSASSKVSPSLVPQLARLLRLSGDRKGARQLMDRGGRE